MRYACTTCCAEKDEAPGLMPARARYRAPRVARVAAAAEREGLPLLILSGALGLLPADEPIPWYDAVLSEDGVEAAAEAAAERLRGLGATELVAWLAPAGTPGWAPYRRTLELACTRAGVLLRLRETAAD